jgi:hypothetical protein
MMQGFTFNKKESSEDQDSDHEDLSSDQYLKKHL